MSEQHVCEPPVEIDSGSWGWTVRPIGVNGDAWRCGRCGKLWTLHNPAWFEASPWERWKHRKLKAVDA